MSAAHLLFEQQLHRGELAVVRRQRQRCVEQRRAAGRDAPRAVVTCAVSEKHAYYGQVPRADGAQQRRPGHLRDGGDEVDKAADTTRHDLHGLRG
jgi:hypothetical protein